MEIKLKENSTLTIKNHSGNTLCSIDEATGAITGTRTKIYSHYVEENVPEGEEPLYAIKVVNNTNTPITNGEMLGGFATATNIVGLFMYDSNLGILCPVSKIEIDENFTSITFSASNTGVSATIQFTDTVRDTITLL